MSTEFSDLTSHRIEGIAVMGDTPFSVPLISRVGEFKQGTLDQGGAKHGLLVAYDVIVSLFPRERYDFFGHTRIELALYDRTGDVPGAQVEWAADQVAYFLEHGNDVLVHCQAGLNRSSLVVADYLMRHEGMTADQAIATVRRRSPACLCNPDFESWLRAR